MSKSPYVSPNLGPTAPWAKQTSTGLFRPPESVALRSSSHEQPSVEDSTRPKSSPTFTVRVGDEKPESAPAAMDGDTRKPKPSPMLHASAQPFYPSSANSPVHGFLPPPPPPPRVASSGISLPPPGTHSLDEILHAVACVVHRDDDQYAALKESNRVLENEIQRYQVERQMQMEEMDHLDMFIEVLAELNRDQHEYLEQHARTRSA